MVKVINICFVFFTLFIHFTNSQNNGFSPHKFPEKLFEEMENLEPGEWTLFITKTPDRHWTFRFRRSELKLGDKVFVWSYFQEDGVDHLYKNEECSVTGILDKGLKKLSNEPTPIPKPTGPSATCTTSETIVGDKKEGVCTKALIFNEDFQSKSLQSLSSWDAEIKFPKDPDYPFNVYTNNGTMTLKDGQLVITPLLLEDMYHDGFVHETLNLANECTGQRNTDKYTNECIKVASKKDILPPVATGKINTRKKFSFRFGKVEVRAKMPAGRWLIPEITLEPLQNLSRNHRYESGLIRVAFVRGNEEFAQKLYGGAVLSDEEPSRSLLMREMGDKRNWTHEFHNYTVIWSPNGLSLLVDGYHYGSVNPGDGFFYTLTKVGHRRKWMSGASKMAPLDQLFYISLGLRVGGLNDFADSADKPWKNNDPHAALKFWQDKANWFTTWHDANLIIDFVKVYAL